jgi:hypothetical protein
MSVLGAGTRDHLRGIREPLAADTLAEMLRQNPAGPAPDVAAVAHG